MTKMSKAQRMAILEAHAIRTVNGGRSARTAARTAAVLVRNDWMAMDGWPTTAGLIAAGVDMDAIHTEALAEDRARTGPASRARRAARGEVVDSYQPVTKTPEEWDADPRNALRILSWSDFGRGLAKILPDYQRGEPITWTQFKAARRGATIQLKPGFTWDDIDRFTPRP